MEFLGRSDQQVKVRGFRIELGEIENQLLKYGEIREVVVVAGENKGGDKYLVAYVVSDSEIALPQLREYLLKVLPDYMIPSYFVRIDDVPLTATGKIDRKALPKPEVKTIKKYIAPRNKREALLVEIWSRVLGIEKETIGIDDNFFELGGAFIEDRWLDRTDTSSL
ncbi:phosphopantetheine-binding protein [Acidobacteriota bacterium]